MREGKIPPNSTYLVQRISQSGVPDNIYLKDTWFTTDIEEYTRKPLINEPSVSPDNNNITLTSPQYEPHVQESTAIERAPVYEVIERLSSNGVQNTSSLNKVSFSQQQSNDTSRMPSCKGDKDLFQPKMSPTLSLSAMYRKSFIHRRNRTNSQ